MCMACLLGRIVGSAIHKAAHIGTACGVGAAETHESGCKWLRSSIVADTDASLYRLIFLVLEVRFLRGCLSSLLTARSKTDTGNCGIPEC